MSRCRACNRRLTDQELQRRLKYSDGRWEYADMCSYCLSVSDNSVYKIHDPRVINDDDPMDLINMEEE